MPKSVRLPRGILELENALLNAIGGDVAGALATWSKAELISLASRRAVPHSSNDAMAHIKGAIVQQAQRIRNEIAAERAANQPQPAPPPQNGQGQPEAQPQAQAQPQPQAQVQPQPQLQPQTQAQAQAVQALTNPVPGIMPRPAPSPQGLTSSLAPQASSSSSSGKAPIDLCDEGDEDLAIMKERRMAVFQKKAKEELPKMEFKSKRSLEESKVLIKVAREIDVLRSLLGEGLMTSEDVEEQLGEIEDRVKERLFLLRTADLDGWGVAKHLKDEVGFFADEKYKKKAKEAKKLAQLDKSSKQTSGYVKAGNGRPSNSRFHPYAAPAPPSAPPKITRCFRCGGAGHYSSQCTSQAGGTANALQPVTWKQAQKQCFSCGLMGHISYQCPGAQKGTQGP